MASTHSMSLRTPFNSLISTNFLSHLEKISPVYCRVFTLLQGVTPRQALLRRARQYHLRFWKKPSFCWVNAKTLERTIARFSWVVKSLKVLYALSTGFQNVSEWMMCGILSSIMPSCRKHLNEPLLKTVAVFDSLSIPPYQFSVVQHLSSLRVAQSWKSGFLLFEPWGVQMENCGHQHLPAYLVW